MLGFLTAGRQSDEIVIDLKIFYKSHCEHFMVFKGIIMVRMCISGFSQVKFTVRSVMGVRM